MDVNKKLTTLLQSSGEWRVTTQDNMIQAPMDVNEKLTTLLQSSGEWRVTTQDNMIQRLLLATFTRSPAPFLKVTKTQHNKFCEPLLGIFALKRRTQN